MLWFTVPSQAVQVFPLLAAAHAIEMTIRLAADGSFPGWMRALAPVIEAALWPVMNVLLLAPQRRAPDQDDTRPL